MPETPQPLPSLLPVPAAWHTDEDTGRTQGRRPVAFALGGLGGFNNYLGGAMASAIDGNVRPALISCSSGAVVWTAEYLTAIHNPELAADQRAPRLRAAAEEAATRTNILPRDFRIANDALIGLFGLPGICRPLWPQYFLNLFWPPSLKTLGQRPSEVAWANDLADRLLPAAWAESTCSAADITRLAEALNQASVEPEQRIGVVFNAYDPNHGEELLFVNQAAVPWLDLPRTRLHRDGSTPRIKYRAINDTAVQAALRLFAYGFDWKVWDPVDRVERVLVDGAYHRQMILKELHEFDLIFAVRPLNDKYQNGLPSNSLGSLTLQTEMWLNGSYDAQIGAIDLLNTIIRNNPGLPLTVNGRPVHRVNVVPVEIKTTYSVFDYFIETLDTYDRGAAQMLESLARHGLGHSHTPASR
jgi:hypothetical protein